MAPAFVPTTEHLRHVLLFLHRSGHSAAESHRLIEETYGDGTLCHTTCTRYFQRFNEGDYTTEDRHRSGRPPTVDLEALRGIVESDPYETTRGMAGILGVTHRAIEDGLKKLGKVQKLGKWLPHELSQNDRDRRVDACVSLLSLEPNYRWLNNIVTGDEKWVMYSNVTRHAQWVDANAAAEPEPKREIHQKKVLLSVWWSRRGIEYYELLPTGQTITADVYSTQLQKLKAELDSSRGQHSRISFLHDNARPHVARKVKQLLGTFGWRVLPHPPYSPDLAPSDFWLFRDLQRFLDGQEFADREDIVRALRGYFKSLPSSFFEEGIDKLPSRWSEVVDGDGQYL